MGPVQEPEVIPGLTGSELGRIESFQVGPEVALGLTGNVLDRIEISLRSDWKFFQIGLKSLPDRTGSSFWADRKCAL